MKIKQDPVTGLWCRSDGAVLMPPDGYRFKSFRWTFGSSDKYGYRQIRFRGKFYKVHRMVCRAFNGLPPADKPFVDHINRVKSANFASNLRWVSIKENAANADRVDRSIEKYGVRNCDDKQAYNKAHRESHREKYNAYWAAKAAKMKAQGFHYTKGPDGKYGWYLRNCS